MRTVLAVFHEVGKRLSAGVVYIGDVSRGIVAEDLEVKVGNAVTCVGRYREVI